MRRHRIPRLTAIAVAALAAVLIVPGSARQMSGSATGGPAPRSAAAAATGPVMLTAASQTGGASADAGGASADAGSAEAATAGADVATDASTGSTAAAGKTQRTKVSDDESRGDQYDRRDGDNVVRGWLPGAEENSRSAKKPQGFDKTARRLPELPMLLRFCNAQHHSR